MTKRSCGPGLIVLMSAVCLTTIASAQTSWWKTYGRSGPDYGYSVQQTTDGGYIIAGETYSLSPGSFDVYLIRTNAQGDTLWTRTYGGPYDDGGHSVQQTSDGGYIVTGWTHSFGAGTPDSANVYLIKTNAQGDTLWARTYGGTHEDGGYSVRQTTDTGYIIVGSTESFGAGGADVYLIRTNVSGDTLWTRTYGGPYYDYGFSVQQTTDGGYIIAGTGSSAHGYVSVIKTNAQGDTLWTRAFGGLSDGGGRSVQQTADGGYIITGYTYPSGSNYSDAYLIRTNASGDTLWTRRYGGTSADDGRSVQQTTDGGYIIAGATRILDNVNVYLVKTGATGDTFWTRTYGGPDGDYGESVQQTTDGGYVVAGWTSGSVSLIKTDANGNVGLAEQSPKPQALGRKLTAAVVRNLPQGTVAYDVMGRRVLDPKPGIYFLRTEATTRPRKVLLVD